MQYKQPLVLKKATLDVKEMEPLPPPPLVHEPTEPDKLILLGAPPVSKEDIESFLSYQSHGDGSTKVVIKSILYAWKKDVILIEFSTRPGKLRPMLYSSKWHLYLLQITLCVINVIYIVLFIIDYTLCYKCYLHHVFVYKLHLLL